MHQKKEQIVKKFLVIFLSLTISFIPLLSGLFVQPVSAATGSSGIAVGYYQSAAVKSDGTVWTWGGNWLGQLGNGTFDYDSHSIPEQVIGLTDV